MISVIVCSRNRAASLIRTLESIKQSMESAPEIPSELIVVDNGSTDSTAAEQHRWATSRPGGCADVHFVFEGTPGISVGRNAGLRASRHGIIALTDDDCVVAPDYIRQVATAHAGLDPAVRGGRILLGDPADLPITIKEDTAPSTYQPMRMPGGFVMGANLTFPRAIYEAVGKFDEEFGGGARCRGAEDTDFVLRASQAGFPVMYDPRIVVSHFHGRRTMEEARKLYASYYVGDGALFAKHFARSRPSRQMLRGTFINLVRPPPRGAAYEPGPLLRFVHTWHGVIRYALGRSRVSQAN